MLSDGEENLQMTFMFIWLRLGIKILSMWTKIKETSLTIILKMLESLCCILESANTKKYDGSLQDIVLEYRNWIESMNSVYL